MIYVIDHNDSFTHNVVHQLSLYEDVECDNYNNLNKAKLRKAKIVVLSPGPGNPRNYPSTSKLSNKLKGNKNIIGICLGFQQILFNEGAQITEQNKIYHGYQSLIKVNNKSRLFKSSSQFKVGRYHSLKLKEPFFAKNFDITMRCKKSNVAMAFENNIDKIYGFQFHPESFLTINGNLLIKKILST